MKYTLKIISNTDYEKIANKYPEKQRNRIKNSWGFTDTKRNVAFVRSRRRIGDMAGVAMHEVMELLANISPHDIEGIRTKGKTKVEYVQPPPPQYSQSPEDKLFYDEYWKNIAIPRAKEEWQIYKDITLPQIIREQEFQNELVEPYLKNQYDFERNVYQPYIQSQYDLERNIVQPRQLSEYNLYKDVFEPASRQLGGILQRELARPITELPSPTRFNIPELPEVKQFPEKDWDKIWQKTKERTLNEYAPIEQRATQRLASSGGLESGAAQQLFKDIDTQKAKQIEDLAVTQALEEWNVKKEEANRIRSESLQNIGLSADYGRYADERYRDELIQNILTKENLRRTPYEDIFRFLGYQPNNANLNLAQPYLYQPQKFSPFTGIPQVSSDRIFAQPIIQPSKTSQWLSLLGKLPSAIADIYTGGANSFPSGSGSNIGK